MGTRIFSLVFTLFLFVVFTLAAIEANNFTNLASFFPLFTAIIAANLALISSIIQGINIYKLKKGIINESDAKDNAIELESENASLGLIFYYVGWVVGYVLIIYLLGLIIATIIFLVLFFTIESKFKVWKTLLATAIVITLIISFGNLMNLYWPTGVINLGIF